jgi:hypothetical protein
MSDEREEREEAEADWYLAWLVAAIESGNEVSVTLYVHGLLVSGIIISQRAFSERLLEGMDLVGRNEADGADGPLLHKLLVAPLHENDMRHARQSEATGEPSVHRFIHLREARCWTPGAEPTPPGLWRGRLAAIDGFELGALGALRLDPRADASP